jgi:hypothetical protein
MARSNGSSALRTPDDAASEAAGGEANRPAGSDTTAMAMKLESLQGMDYAALWHEWRRLYRASAPQRVGRDLLMLGVAWKIQEQALGGMGATTRRRLADLAQMLERDGDVTRNRVARLKPGAKLVREWRGETHTVIVLDNGFEWQGRHWRSLSAIAREISGGHWSGPRFFGLAGKRAETVKASDA